MAPVLSASFSRSRPLFVSMKPTLTPTFSWVTTSASEDLAMLRNFIWFLMCSLSTPSAIFEGTERPALVIWSLKPKSFMCLLISYIWQDSSKTAFHTSSLLNFIVDSFLDYKVTPLELWLSRMCFLQPAAYISFAFAEFYAKQYNFFSLLAVFLWVLHVFYLLNSLLFGSI